MLLAGQPGAGKTRLSSLAVSLMDGDTAFVNADDYRRYHPGYRRLYAEFGSDCVVLTGAFSSVVAERLIQRLSDHHLNLVVEGTGRTVEVPKRTAELLAAKGYAVEVEVEQRLGAGVVSPQTGGPVFAGTGGRGRGAGAAAWDGRPGF